MTQSAIVALFTVSALSVALSACSLATSGLDGAPASASGSSGAAGASSSAAAGGGGGAPASASAGPGGGAGGSGTGGSAPEDLCGSGSTAEMADDFNASSQGSAWDAYEDPDDHTSVTQENGALEVNTDGANGAFAGYISKSSATRSLRRCHVAIQVTQVPDQSLDLLTEFQLTDNGPKGQENSVSIELLKGDLSFRQVIGGSMAPGSAFTPYDSTAHRWWRFHELGVNLAFETSPDGKKWTVRHQVETPPFVDKVHINLSMGAVDDAEPGKATFDNLNIPPP